MSLLSPARLPIRRRNALVPLPLLPPVPRNTIVTSVRIVHNQCVSDANIFDTSTVGHSPPLRAFSNAPPPPSPTATNLCFAPLNMGMATKRLRPGRRRSSCTPCQAPPCSQKSPPATNTPPPSKPPPSSVAVPRPNSGGGSTGVGLGTDPPPPRPTPTTAAIPCDSEYDSSLLNPNRKPRSTIVVTVRSVNPSDPSYDSGTPKHPAAPRRSPDRGAGTGGAGGIVYTHGQRRPPDGGIGIDPSGRRPPDEDGGRDDDVHPSKYRPPPDDAIGVGDAWSALLARRRAHKPRVTSPLALWVTNTDHDPDQMELDPWDVSPLSTPPAPWSSLYTGPPAQPPSPPLPFARRHLKRTKHGGTTKKGKAKNWGRVGMLRWALLNESGPEVGRRILAMGPHLAQEIWEAERVIETAEAQFTEMEITEQTRGTGVEPACERESTAVEHRHPHQHGSDVEPAVESDVLVEDKHGTDVRTPDKVVMEHKHGSDNEEQLARERLADECIRELEEMDVDSEDVVMEASPAVQEATEKAAETPPIENNNSNSMDLDMPAPVAAVAPLSTARQVQIQLEIAVQVFSPAKKTQKEAEKSKRWFERIAL